MTISSKYFFPKTATLIAAIVILAFIIGFSINPIKNYFAKKEVAQVNEILNSENDPKTLDQCKVILNFNKAKAQGNEFFNESLFDKVFKQCDENYNLVYVDLNEDNCRFIISEPKAYFKRNYVFYDNLSDKRNECIGKFLVPTFST
ncbi:MAG: hypothetical protein LBF15_04265 [Candidatus Peribacteria bacterium]|jgi:hypothetical protein|nr:hypothetical protein [Candidatus Peribacteria bacterium]